MLDLDPTRTPVLPRPAATTLVLRERHGLEVLCILRHPKSTFLGGVLAFPGGKVDPSDHDEAWETLLTGLDPHMAALEEVAPARALAVAACREALEEVAVLPVAGLDQGGASDLRTELTDKTLSQLLRERGLRLDVSLLRPYARWVTPEAEARRYDTAFFLLPLPEGQQGASDLHETTAAFWETPAKVLERWRQGEFQIVPPTVRSLELLVPCASLDEALALADRQSLLPLCPRFVPDDRGGFLALPGDPAHEIKEKRVEGSTRFVLVDGRFEGRDPGASI
jgi:8-oxo-dGTP pyrophosphatase MutT (NUDIX family)